MKLSSIYTDLCLTWAWQFWRRELL